MAKIPKVSNRELDKWIKILGVYRIKELYIASKIQLSKEQLDYLVEYDKKDDKKDK